MKKSSSAIILLIFLASCSGGDLSELSPAEPRCDNLINPSGTGESPQFSWIITSENRGNSQTAYQLILNTSPLIKDENTALWNSGKIISQDSYWISYSGPALEPGHKYYWKVRIWDESDKVSGWSETSYFITGLFDESDWDGAYWIGYEDIPDSMILVPGIHKGIKIEGDIAQKRSVVPYFRKEFSLSKKVKQALVFISGLGHYELTVNGHRTSDSFLSPGWTDYHKTCYFNTLDITDLLSGKTNTLGVLVGNGFYNINRERYYKLVITYGAPKLLLKLKIVYKDGTEEIITTDETWKTSASPITFASLFGGEDYDARLEQPGWDRSGFNDDGWKNAVRVKDPGGILRPEPDHPLRVHETFDPVSIFSPDSGIFVYDFGQNASGIISLAVKGKEGCEIRLSPAELITSDSIIAQRASGTPYYFSYTTKGEGIETWSPRFTYYGFRYLQAEGAVPAGLPSPGDLPVIKGIRMLHTRNSSPAAGSFKCSNELFNSIYDLINWAIKSNLASVATDCPHREKLGWLEQTHLMGNSVKYIYDIHNLFDKMIDDMMEAQCENGLVPNIAPEYVAFKEGFRDSPEWSSACIILPWDLYEWYGDAGAIEKAWPMMEAYMHYLESMATDNILDHGLGDWYDLGPRSPGVAQLTPLSLTATAIYFYDATLMSRMAELTGRTEEASGYKDLAERIRKSFNNKFLDPETKVYSTGSQTAYSMPLFFGMVDDSIKPLVVENLVSSITENNKSLTAGDVGYRYLIRALEQEGFSQLIFEMNSRSDVPGYGYQLAKGATALTESWAGLTNVSNNHMMLGHLMEWFYSGPGGIRQAPGSSAYKNIIIAPEIVGDIIWCEASYKTIRGEIRSSWKKEGNILTLEVSIPPNSLATVEIPADGPDEITENGLPVSESASVKAVGTRDGRVLLETGSGNYIFRTTMPSK
ncbi:MAG: glycoside hydrolase family 78 protein [Bacteroidales bacterium]|nr:glycoside hydrolase family 78 protein [Bacteroidales bacterium]MBN2634421.1 glycoside hydrolase family 78 protein [Bacteroidales bacterium]